MTTEPIGADLEDDFQGLETAEKNFPSLGNSVRAQKRELRARMRAALTRLTPSERAAAGDAAALRLADLPAFRAARRVALYLALPGEMPTAPILDRCAREGRSVAVPAFDAAAGRYRLCAFDPARPLRRGPLGIAEPETPAWLDGEPDLWIVPGLAFDARGGRLGRGAGWYDRMLADAQAPRVGLAFDAQVAEEVPMEDGDRAMDFIVTEKQTIVCERARARSRTADGTAPAGVFRGTREQRT